MKFCPQCGAQLEVREFEERQHKACASASCHFVYWNNPVPVVAALVIHNDHVVLARNASWPSGFFSLVTGYLEENENPDSCVVREVKEELNLEVQDIAFIGHYNFKVKNQLLIAFAVNVTGNLQLNEELAEHKMIPLAELADYDFQPLYIAQAIVTDWIKSQTGKV